MKHSIIIKANELEAVAITASHEETRYYMNGVLVEIYKDKSVGLISTDGHRLSSLNTKDLPIVDSFIIGNKDIARILIIYKQELKGLTRQQKEWLSLRITHDKDSLLFETVLSDGEAVGCVSSSSFNSKPVDGNFPEWRRVIPSEDKTEACPLISFNADYMASFAKICHLLTRNKVNQVVTTLTGAGSPIKISFPENASYLGVLMPMRA